MMMLDDIFHCSNSSSLNKNIHSSYQFVVGGLLYDDNDWFIYIPVYAIAMATFVIQIYFVVSVCVGGGGVYQGSSINVPTEAKVVDITNFSVLCV